MNQGRSLFLNWLLPALAAAALTALLYLAILPAFKGTYAHGLLALRGPIQHAIIFLTFWAGCSLLWKVFETLRENRACKGALLPDEPRRINHENTRPLLEQLDALPQPTRNSLLARRVRGGLESFQANGDVQEVATTLNMQSDVDARNSENSFTLVKVFIAVIPLMGFIGTVLGISTAVGGFGDTLQGATELSAIKNSLTGVTSGLSTAFDTTLLALLMSVCLMLPVSSCQQAEEKLLSRVDDYATNEFLTRLEDAERQKNPVELLAADLKEALITLNYSITAQANQWRDTSEQHTTMLQSWSTNFTNQMEAMQKKLVQSQTELHEGASKTQHELAKSINESSQAAARQAEDVVNLYRDVNERVSGPLTESFERNLQELQSAHRDGLREHLERIEMVLAQQQKVSAEHARVMEAACQSLAEQTVKWQSRESGLQESFETQARHNLDAMRSMGERIAAPQHQLTTALEKLAQNTAQQAEAYGEFLPHMSEEVANRLDSAQSQMQETGKQQVVRIAECFENAAAGLREQSERQTEILATVLAQLQHQNRALEQRVANPAAPPNNDNGSNGNGHSRWSWLLGRKGNGHVTA
tara:strand:- start:338 stop:2101 length:1764 start_codon:yes stop_codon:yes gene_type:complete